MISRTLSDDNLVLMSTPKQSFPPDWAKLGLGPVSPRPGECYFDVPTVELLEALARDPKRTVVDEPGGPDQSAMLVRMFDRFRAGLCACGCTEADHGPVSFRPCNACRCFAWRPSYEACHWYTRRAEQGDYRSVHPLHGGAFAQ